MAYVPWPQLSLIFFVRKIGLPLFSLVLLLNMAQQFLLRLFFRESGMVIIPDPNNFPIPVDANPEREPIASGATTLGAILATSKTSQCP